MGFECDYHCRGKIIEKEFGKFKVYFADQSQFPSVSEAELKTMDEEIESVIRELWIVVTENSWEYLAGEKEKFEE